MTNLNEQMEMFDKEMSERKELDKLNKLFSKGVPFLKEQFSEEELENNVKRLRYLKDLYESPKYFKKIEENGGTRIISGNMSDKMAEQIEKNSNKKFQQGGLEQDGGTQDPVSGNKVPIGSAQVEVRDDIPAMLSEGEFVFPADVVRFIGLEKLMQIRQEAKAGLKRMEDMGQMGNSSEATIPDDVPFTIDDLEVEEDTSRKMQAGGMPVPMPSLTSQYFPQQALTVNPQLTAPTSTPANMTNVNLQGQYGQAVQPLYSVQAPTAPIDVTAVGSDSFTGGGFGTPDEIKVYVTPDGKEQNIGFKGGQPLSPIPPGAVLKTDFTEPPKPKTTESARVKSASVLEEGEERKVDDGLGEGAGRIALGGKPSRTKKGIIDGASVFGVSYDIPGFSPLNLTQAVAGIAMGKPLPEDAIVTLTKDGVSTKLNAKEFENIKNNPRGKKAEEIIQKSNLEKFAETISKKPDEERDKFATKELQKAMEEGEKYSEGATETLAEAMSVGEDRDPTGTAGAFTGEPTGMEDEYD